MGYDMGQLTCGEKFIKYVLFVFNFIFWLAGAAILGFGIWLKVDPRLLNLLQIASSSQGNQLIDAAAIVLMVVGALMFVIGGLGCCGACQESAWMLTGYSSLLLLLIVLQITAGILAAVYRNKIMSTLSEDMQNTVKNKYKPPNKDGKKDALTLAWDFMQVQFKCCGANSYKDWENSTWIHSNPKNYTVPETCCVLKNNDHIHPDPKNTTMCQAAAMSSTPNQAYVHVKGCYPEMKEFIHRYGIALIGIAFGFIILQLIGVVIGCCLRSAIVKANQYA